MVAVRQTSFHGGELAPAMWGRTDFKTFNVGARKLLNFFINKQGSAMSRPGTRYVKEFFFTTSIDCLFPYVYSDSIAYVILAGASTGLRAIKFDKSTGAVTDTLVAGAPAFAGVAHYEEIQYAQVGAVLVFTHPDMATGPKQLTFNGVAWTFGDLDFSYPTLVWRSIPGGTQDCASAPAIIKNAAYLPVGSLGAAQALDPWTASATSPLKPWRYAVSAVIKDAATGALVETRPYLVANWFDGTDAGALTALAATQQVAVGVDKPLHLRRKSPAGGVVPLVNVVTYNYYKGQNGLFGFIGSSTELEFVDTGIEPNYEIQPLRPTAVSPWQLDSAGAVFDYPSAVAHFENRRAFGGGIYRPGTVLASASGDFSNLDDYALAWHGEPLKFDLASMKRERLRALVGHSALLAFTDTSVWAVSGGAGTPLDFDSLSARLVDHVGSRSIQPLVVEGSVLYVRAKGAGVRRLSADFNTPSGGYKPADVSAHAAHLFTGPNVALALYGIGGSPTPKAWCYAEDPFGLVWLVRKDGILLIGTPTDEGVAWTQHAATPSTIGGTVHGYYSICSVPEGDEDAVYALAHHGGFKALTRFESRVHHDDNDDVACLDCAVKVKTVGLAGTLAVPAIYNGSQVWAVGRNNPALGPVTVAAGVADFNDLLLATINPETGTPYTDWIENDGAGEADLFVGFAFQCDLETLDPISPETRNHTRNITKVGFEVDNPIGLQVGPHEGQLVEAKPGYSTRPYDATSLSQEVAYAPSKAAWNDGRAFLRQTLPLPVTVLGITREVDFGG